MLYLNLTMYVTCKVHIIKITLQCYAFIIIKFGKIIIYKACIFIIYYILVKSILKTKNINC